MTELPPLTDKELLAWGDSSLDVRMYVTAALRASLPATTATPDLILELAHHGHWCLPILRALYWLQHDVSPIEAQVEASKLRANYQRHLEALRASSAESRAYNLRGKVSAAERKATTDALFANLDIKL